MGQDGITREDWQGDVRDMVPANMSKHAFWAIFNVIVAPGSIHGANRDREQTKAVTLFKSGLQSMLTTRKKVGIADPEGEMKRMAEEHEKGFGPGAGGGRTPRMSRGQRTGKIA
jgi:hypothetical protein